MIQQEFALKAKHILEKDNDIIGLAVGGSWLADEIDEFSDLDLILVSKTKLSDDKNKMLELAQRLGSFLSGFTGEHVGEPRLLICLYGNPLLHVDIKFVTLEELNHRVETPHILFDREGQIKEAFKQSKERFPLPDYQWIEDRFWTWIHYALLKIGRGEYLEAFDFFSFLQMVVLGPLLHLKNGNLPRGVRKVEMEIDEMDFVDLKSTIPKYERQSLLNSLQSSIELYRGLRKSLFNENIILQSQTEKKVMDYFKIIEKKK